MWRAPIRLFRRRGGANVAYRQIPIAHIGGGETTEGAIDEPIRHATTKMAHLHFVGTELYCQRVIQLGEHPEHVFNFGDPGLDNINHLNSLNREDFEAAIGWSLGKIHFLVTYHPVTLIDKASSEALEAIFAAPESFSEA